MSLFSFGVTITDLIEENYHILDCEKIEQSYRNKYEEGSWFSDYRFT